MKTRTSRLAAAALTGAVVLGGAGIAAAGHSNPLLETELRGRNEASANGTSKKNVGDPNGRGEGYVFRIDPDRVGGVVVDDNTDTLCYVLTVDRIADTEQNPGAPRMAHIHRGAVGENGPVVANLAFPTGGQAADCLSADEDGKFNGGSTEANQAIIDAIFADPSGYYFNVHNSEFPDGAIRGQLSEQGHDH